MMTTDIYTRLAIKRIHHEVRKSYFSGVCSVSVKHKNYAWSKLRAAAIKREKMYGYNITSVRWILA